MQHEVKDYDKIEVNEVKMQHKANAGDGDEEDTATDLNLKSDTVENKTQINSFISNSHMLSDSPSIVLPEPAEKETVTLRIGNINLDTNDKLQDNSLDIATVSLDNRAKCSLNIDRKDCSCCEKLSCDLSVNSLDNLADSIPSKLGNGVDTDPSDAHDDVEGESEAVSEAVEVCMDVSLKINSSEIYFSGSRDGHEGHLSAETFISPAKSENKLNEVIIDSLQDSTKSRLNDAQQLHVNNLNRRTILNPNFPTSQPADLTATNNFTKGCSKNVV